MLTLNYTYRIYPVVAQGLWGTETAYQVVLSRMMIEQSMQPFWGRKEFVGGEDYGICRGRTTTQG
jgi:hypothetical protein